MFIGSFTYQPNIAAAELLISQVWPLVKKAVPEARLVIAGNKPDRIPSFATHPEGVEFAGFVENLSALYKKTQVVCCPILVGGGTRVKIIEAAAYGKAVVSTTIGAEGIEFCDGKEILLRDGEAGLAEACIDLLNASHQCHELGERAREKTIKIYDRGQIIAAIRKELAV